MLDLAHLRIHTADIAGNPRACQDNHCLIIFGVEADVERLAGHAVFVCRINHGRNTFAFCNRCFIPRLVDSGKQNSKQTPCGSSRALAHQQQKPTAIDDNNRLLLVMSEYPGMAAFP